MRDYIDWTLYIATHIARNITTGVTIEFPDEGGQRKIVFKGVDPEIVQRYGFGRIAIRLAEWIVFQLSVWHEIATWYGWSWVRTFPETASAFSPEDLYSNLLGVNITVGIVHRRYTSSDHVFNQSADTWIRLVAHHLGAVPQDVAAEAMRSVDQHWWDSSRRLPDKEPTLRRHLDADTKITPWLIPPDRAPESLRKACGENPTPAVVELPNSMLGYRFSDWIQLVVDVDGNLAAQEPFTELGGRATTEDFPKIISAIREQNREEFGPNADQPD